MVAIVSLASPRHDLTRLTAVTDLWPADCIDGWGWQAATGVQRPYKPARYREERPCQGVALGRRAAQLVKPGQAAITHYLQATVGLSARAGLTATHSNSAVVRGCRTRARSWPARAEAMACNCKVRAAEAGKGSTCQGLFRWTHSQPPKSTNPCQPCF